MGGAIPGGNLVINGGTITACGGNGCAGIGSCATSGTTSTKMFGDITINGGTVTASALDNAAGIGSGKGTPCGNITITGGTVTATGDGRAAGIGSGDQGGCGDITIAGTITKVVATKGSNAANSIGGSSSIDIANNLVYNQDGDTLVLKPVVDLGNLNGNYEAENFDVLTGTLKRNKKITIAAGATITLRDADITSLDGNAGYAGITPLGDATIILEGTNVVKGGSGSYPAIFVPENTTLTIEGEGSLTVTPGTSGCGIGGGWNIASGNIVINGGIINATATGRCAAIGTGYFATGGSITITGGIITATGCEYGAAIGAGSDGKCGNITIAGGSITAYGNTAAAGIGTGFNGNCGNITITNTVAQVTATAGQDAFSSIGVGNKGGVGTVTIGGTVYADGIEESPYTYQP